MSDYVLGISCFYHDAAAALVKHGEIVAAAQEERFSRKKHDPRFPVHAINYCLEEAFIESDELAAVVFYDHPVLSFDRITRNALVAGDGGAAQWARAAASFVKYKFRVEELVKQTLRNSVPVYCTRHHLSHAASAFFPSPFEEAAVLTVDGVGEWATTSIALGHGRELETLEEIHYPHSLGLLYSAFTFFCGFKVNSGEYKLMGLAPYGEKRFERTIREHLIELRDDGSYRLNLDYFGFVDTDYATNDNFSRLFGGPARIPESRISRREMDLAASIQRVIEDAILGLARRARERTGSANLCMAGGVALNCVANGRLLRASIFDKLWLQPASGDAGGALGAALAYDHMIRGTPRSVDSAGGDSQQGSYLGPAYSAAQVRAFLGAHSYPYMEYPTMQACAEEVAAMLAQGKVVGLMTGRMEFGPRALGGRSILGNPKNPETQITMNLKIKYRESFRPFAPAVLIEDAAEYFDLDCESPYMLLVAPVLHTRRQLAHLGDPDDGDDPEDLLALVRKARSDIPAVTHVDYSARIQTVDKTTNPLFRAILTSFKSRTGCAVLVNTSFNVRGEPIVCSPEDAYRCFMRTEMDALVMENCLLLKEIQPKQAIDDNWKEEYALD